MIRTRAAWDAWILGLLVFFIGILNIVSSVSPSLPDRMHLLEDVLPLVLVRSSRHLVVVIGLILVLIARGIVRRKRVAWWSAFILILATVVLHLLKGLDYEEAALSGLVVVVMILLFPRFQARSDIPTSRNAFTMLVVIVALNIGYGIMGFSLLYRGLGVQPGLINSLLETLSLMFTSRTQVAVPTTPHAHWFLNSLWLLWETGIIIFMYLLLKPVVYRSGLWREERERASQIAQEYGGSSLVYFTLWNDKVYYFNRDQTTYIAYRQVGDVAVALGDPVGAERDLGETIAGFIDFCFTNGWQPAFYQVLPDHLSLYRRLGMRALHIGDEAIVDLAGFEMSGRKFKALRNNLHKFEKEGYRPVWYDPPLDDSLLERLEQVSKDWLLYQGGEEKSFSLGWFDPGMLRHNQVVTVEDENGEIYAFANSIPMYTLPQASPDLMRYSRQAPAGTMDYLFVQSMLHYKEMGYAGYNLGLAPLAHVGKEENSSVAEKAISLLYDNFYNFKGLYNFKAKFAPRWEPRYLIYPDLVALPRVALAIVKAGNPNGYTKFWRWFLMRLHSRLGIQRREAVGKRGTWHHD